EEFEKRARHLVARCTAAKPGRPVILITIFRNAAHHLVTPDEITIRQEDFDRILRQITRDHRDRNVHLIEGVDVVDDLSCLTSDLLHPHDFGHARMAENLARLLKPILAPFSTHSLPDNP
ncbi:MAG: SGNH/GDSL hydrolase family protein, partial [Opitutaceae bacterium]|nr:SGNH/GDSL hydrolase family protein [Opitutaceae bacterium]